MIWHLLTTGAVYQDLGDNYFETRRDPQRQARRLVCQLEDLGFSVTLASLPAASA